VRDGNGSWLRQPSNQNRDNEILAYAGAQHLDGCCASSHDQDWTRAADQRWRATRNVRNKSRRLLDYLQDRDLRILTATCRPWVATHARRIRSGRRSGEASDRAG
jgi:hypothetical protein